MTHMACTTLTFLMIGGLTATLGSHSDSNGFLRASPRAQQRMSEEDVQTSLLAEVEATLGEGSASTRTKQFEGALSSIYAALPKNEEGYLGHATVQYALHRIFVQRHGWVIKGLDSAGGHRNSTSGAGLLKEQVPSYVQELFEKRLGGRGFGLHELAVVAATIEHLVHNEAIKRVGDAFSAHDLLPTSLLNESMTDEILDTYMTAYVLGDSIPDAGPAVMLALKAEMDQIYMAWNETTDFVRTVRRAITESDASEQQKASGVLDFSIVARIAERVSEQFGTFQNRDCVSLKSRMMQVEEKGSTGRVALPDFFKMSLDTPELFQENLPYLRQVGALDETDADRPRVMISNYLYSKANCIGSSGFYAICCIDECESLLGHLEQQIVAPEATPARIAGIVAELSSSSVLAPRTLAPVLLDRLGEIAAEHGGSVPLHGRLFAQWMHHAYPRECPYPHVAGTTNPESHKEWSERTGEVTYSSTEEKQAHVDQAANMTRDDVEGLTLPWALEEELLVVRKPQVQMAGGNSLLSNMRNVMLFMAVVSSAYGFVHKSLGAKTSKESLGNEKFLV